MRGRGWSDPRRSSGSQGQQATSLWRARTRIFTLQGAQSSIRSPPKARQCCKPPQTAIRHA
eukprot:13209698-Alexandrium_andersonii.AAC.1